ncbi:ABC transporter permease [Brevibacterium oceani]|uniref:ABC transporter permease n=1 Tax=Brevibacterium oceani TaxID=358099 RepID=UPI0015E7048A|nr:ABC transporter permease [Brevibacterium oceani]
MNPSDVLASSLRGVTANPLRSILTMLGVLIGVAAVIVLTAVGNGSAQSVNDAISTLGSSTLTVRSSSGGMGPGQSGQDASSDLTTETAAGLSDMELGHVDLIVPEVSTTATVTADSLSSDDVSVIGTSADYFEVGDVDLSSGSAFDASAEEQSQKVVVIGSTLASDLFSSGSAVGQTIGIDGTSYTVSGVMSQQDSSGQDDPNSSIIAPISRVQASLTGLGSVDSLTVLASDSDSVIAAEGELEIGLNQLLGIDDEDDETYSIVNQSELLETQQETAQTFTVLLAAVAGISLLVGGIGVTNIMLVTVTERTREIGIRKALGAARPAILMQFLVEAALLTLAGGILGVLLAIVVTRFEISGTQPVIVAASIPIALGISVAIGIFFGVYPAWRAASMRPIEALRSS